MMDVMHGPEAPDLGAASDGDGDRNLRADREHEALRRGRYQ
jgi:phosphoglucomutase